jgi:hypothetical protein
MKLFAMLAAAALLALAGCEPEPEQPAAFEPPHSEHTAYLPPDCARVVQWQWQGSGNLLGLVYETQDGELKTVEYHYYHGNYRPGITTTWKRK